MNSSLSVAGRLSYDARKSLAISSLSKIEPLAHLADRAGVSRQFIYRQKQKAGEALDEAFTAKTGDVLFHLPVTEAWLNQLTLALILICRSSYRGVEELLRDLFDTSISVGAIHNRLHCAAGQAAAINRSLNLSAIRVGLLDEIFQGSTPVLAGVDAASTYCYLLADAAGSADTRPRRACRSPPCGPLCRRPDAFRGDRPDDRNRTRIQDRVPRSDAGSREHGVDRESTTGAGAMALPGQ